jgi:hypothetical protein
MLPLHCHVLCAGNMNAADCPPDLEALFVEQGLNNSN